MNIILKDSIELEDRANEPAISDESKLSSVGRVIIKTIKSLGMIFQVTVVVPLLISIAYFGFLASDVYISEARFVVRSPEKPAASGLGVLLRSAGFANSGEFSFAAEDYVRSRDALEAINHDGFVTKAYTRDPISLIDRFDRFGWNGSFEDLFIYYGKRVRAVQESSATITTLTVKAYTPADALEINRRLLAEAELLINRLSDRGRTDLVAFANGEVEAAKGRAQDAAIAMSQFREASGVVNPEQQGQVQIQMVSKLQDELITTRNQLFQLRSVAPENAQISVLEARAESLRGEIADELAKAVGNRDSLAKTSVDYERLALEAQFAQQQLAGALVSLAEAENEARRKQAYVETIVAPHLPDEALEPRRLRGIVTTLVLGLIAWAIISMLIAGVREHKD